MVDLARLVEDGGSGEDRAGVFIQDELTVIAVADGAGGMAGGGEAADRLIVEVEQTLRSTPSPLNPLVWSACLSRVDQALRDKGQTTGVIVVLGRDVVLGASAGDSEAHLFGPDGMEQLTERQVRKPLLGSGAATPIPFRQAFVDGTIVVATDGLWKYAKRAALDRARNADRMDQLAFDLMESVRLPSGHLPDDVAIVAARRT